MELDQSTLAAVMGVKCVIVSVIFYILHLSVRRISGIFLWAIGSLLIGTAILIDEFGILTHPELASLSYNIPLVSGQVLFLAGSAQIVGRPFKGHALALMMSSVTLLTIIFTLVSADPTLRVLVLSVIFVMANGWMAWILWRFRVAHMQFAYSLAAATMLVQAAAALMQALVALDVKGLEFLANAIIWVNAMVTIVSGGWELVLLIMLHVVEELKGAAEKKERERIARDLHDTVLQTFQGFVMKANAMLPESEPALKERLRLCVRDAITAIQEGRDKVRTLRGNAGHDHSLHEYLRMTGEQEAASGQQFILRCIGKVRALDSAVQRELCAIGKEALCNAFRHANARKHEVLVDYGSKALILTIKDDGKGIGDGNSGNHGHWGMQGIAERAMLIQAKANVHTARDVGTTWRIEVEANLAYAGGGRSGVFD